MSPGGRVRRRDSGGFVDELDKGSAACAGLDEGLVVGTEDGAGLAEGADELLEKKRPNGGRERRIGGEENRQDETRRGGRKQAGAGDESGGKDIYKINLKSFLAECQYRSNFLSHAPRFLQGDRTVFYL